MQPWQHFMALYLLTSSFQAAKGEEVSVLNSYF